MKDFTLQWDLPNRGLSDFSTNLNVAPWYIDLRTKMTYSFATASPTCTIKGSGIGLDGSYWAVMDGSNFVLVEKTGAYAIYFSTSATPPANCSALKNAEMEDSGENSLDENISMFPNPIDRNGVIEINLSKIAPEGALISFSDLSGKLIYSTTLFSINNSIKLDENFLSGFYIVSIVNRDRRFIEKLIIK
jgi:hypothetical protein